jgi:hypothetical protein
VTTARAEGNGTGEQPATKPVVYLAECSYDRKQDRETLAGELRRLGYGVLPDRELPRDEPGYVDAVERLLDECRLAVHLIGAGYGAVPDGPSQKSIVELQNDLALRRSKGAALERVIWLPEGTESDQAPQKAFLKALHTDAEAQFGADVITGDFEALKTAIFARLKRLEGAGQDRGASQVENRSRLIYLICTEKDRHATVPVRKFLQEQGLEVSLPAFDGDAAAIHEVHTQSLADCVGVLLFYGAGDEAWKRAMDNELRKMSAYRSGKPLLANVTYLADPKTADKQDLIDFGDPDLLDGLSDAAQADLSAFVRAVTSTDGTG